MSKESYKVPASTKKGSPMTAIPTTLVKGSLWSRTGSMEGGRMLRAGEVGKISVPATCPSPPAKGSVSSPSAPPSPPAKKD